MKLTAEKRDGAKAQLLRRQGLVPAIVYNSELNVPVSVDRKAFDKVFRERGTSQVIDLDVDGESHDVLVKAVQMDKRRREPLHVDFYAVTAGQTVEVAVRIIFEGTPAGAKEGGQVDVQRREVGIRILPRLIPESIHVDVSELEMGDSLHVSDVIDLLPSEAEITDDEELTLIAVLSPRAEEEEEPTPTEGILQPELIGEEVEEGEGAPAPGESVVTEPAEGDEDED